MSKQKTIFYFFWKIADKDMRLSISKSSGLSIPMLSQVANGTRYTTPDKAQKIVDRVERIIQAEKKKNPSFVFSTFPVPKSSELVN